MNTPLLDELIAADAQGERALCTLWPQDQIYYRHEWHTILSMQLVKPRAISFKTDTGHHFLFDGYLIFPAMMSDEHAAQERAGEPEVW